MVRNPGNWGCGISIIIFGGIKWTIFGGTEETEKESE
jgi:hypothetical protein